MFSMGEKKFGLMSLIIHFRGQRNHLYQCCPAVVIERTHFGLFVFYSIHTVSFAQIKLHRPKQEFLYSNSVRVCVCACASV